QVSQQSFYNIKIIEASIIPQSVFPIPDTQKMIDEALAKQKSNYDAEIEKLRKE
ncbi:22775_t:CDS:1, partial [Racocetra persica]